MHARFFTVFVLLLGCFSLYADKGKLLGNVFATCGTEVNKDGTPIERLQYFFLGYDSQGHVFNTSPLGQLFKAEIHVDKNQQTVTYEYDSIFSTNKVVLDVSRVKHDEGAAKGTHIIKTEKSTKEKELHCIVETR